MARKKTEPTVQLPADIYQILERLKEAIMNLNCVDLLDASIAAQLGLNQTDPQRVVIRLSQKKNPSLWKMRRYQILLEIARMQPPLPVHICEQYVVRPDNGELVGVNTIDLPANPYVIDKFIEVLKKVVTVPTVQPTEMAFNLAALHQKKSDAIKATILTKGTLTNNLL